VVIAEIEMDGILADEFYFSKFEAVRDMNGKHNALPCHLILTGGAGAQSAKHRGEMPRFVAVCPEDLKLTGTEFLNLRRGRGF